MFRAYTRTMRQVGEEPKLSASEQRRVKMEERKLFKPCPRAECRSRYWGQNENQLNYKLYYLFQQFHSRPFGFSFWTFLFFFYNSIVSAGVPLTTFLFFKSSKLGPCLKLECLFRKPTKTNQYAAALLTYYCILKYNFCYIHAEAAAKLEKNKQSSAVQASVLMELDTSEHPEQTSYELGTTNEPEQDGNKAQASDGELHHTAVQILQRTMEELGI